MDFLLRPWRRYADFSGRSTRREFLLLGLVNTLVVTLLFVLGSALAGVPAGAAPETLPPDKAVLRLVPALLFMAAIFIPTLACAVRRVQDQNKTGAALLFVLVPVVGFMFLLLIAFYPGTDGPNGYGADPRDGDEEPEEISAPRAPAMIVRSERPS